jgi:cysteine desulfurase
MAALEQAGWRTGGIPVDEGGGVRPEFLNAAVDDSTVLVCIMYANNEIGRVQAITKLSAEVKRLRADRISRGITRPLYLYVDAAQAGYLNLKVDRLGVDLLSLGGSKIYGPAGSGLLYVRTGVELEPLFYGGGQEGQIRSGTENLEAAVGLATALELVQAEAKKESQRQQKMRDWLWGQIQKTFPESSLNGDQKARLAGNLNITFPGVSGETLVAHLDREGFAVATGSACTAANEDPSHVLLALGRTREAAESSLRITLGRPTSQAELQRLVTVLRRVVPRVRQLSG